MFRVLPFFTTTALVALSGSSALAVTLTGSELRLRGEAQLTPTSERVTNSLPASAIVSESEVEFPNSASLFDPDSPVLPGFARRFVDSSIDVGADFIEIDYGNAGFGRFATGFQNTAVYTFTAPIALQITEAVVDPSTTFPALISEPDRVIFEGNELFINYESLRYTPSSFVRINLETAAAAEPDPVSVPEPSTAFLLAGVVMAGMATGLRQAN